MMPRIGAAGSPRARRVLLSVVLSGIGVLVISGCAVTGPRSSPAASPAASHSTPRPHSSHTSLPGGDPSPGMGFDTKAGATCGVLSVIDTNLTNSFVEHTGGTINDGSYATIINTVIPDLRVIDGLSGYHLQDEIQNLNSAIAKSPAKLTGADFDPDSDAFASAIGRAAQKCNEKDSPMTISSTTGG